MVDDNGGRFGFVSGLAHHGKRVETFRRRLGQGGCAIVYQLKVDGKDRERTVSGGVHRRG